MASLLGLSVSRLGNMTHICFPYQVKRTKLGKTSLRSGCLIQLLNACKPEPTIWEGVLSRRSAYVQSCCLWLTRRQQRTAKRSLCNQVKSHRNSLASNCNWMLRAAVGFAGEVKSLWALPKKRKNGFKIQWKKNNHALYFLRYTCQGHIALTNFYNFDF